uniref:Uncharacterized protein n=1 Tax=Anopheles merus TaxID=30066 RepID=A0A182V1B2_ANOME
MSKFPSASDRLPDSPDSTEQQQHQPGSVCGCPFGSVGIVSCLPRSERDKFSPLLWALLGDNFCRLPVLAKVSSLLDPVTCTIRPGPKGILMSEPDLFRSAARFPTWPTTFRPGRRS